MSTTSTVWLVADYPTLEIDVESNQVLVQLTAQLPTLSVTGLTGWAGTVTVVKDVSLDDLEVTAATGTVSSVEVEAKLPTLQLWTGDTVELVGESSLEVTSLTGGAAAVSLVAPVPTLGIEGSGDQVASVSLQPAKPTLAITAASGSVSAVELVAVLPSLYITGFRVGDSVVELTAPLPALEVTGLFGSSSTIVLIAPEPELLIWPDLDSALAGIFAAYVMSMETTKVSTYSNFPFKALVHHRGTHFGVAADGIYELAGSNDAGSQINATIKFGYDDIGSDQFKRVPHVYVGCKADGDLQLTISVDGAPEQATQFSPEMEGIHNAKVKPGRGHRGRYWKPGLVNVAGCDFEVASMSLVEELLKRRVS